MSSYKKNPPLNFPNYDLKYKVENEKKFIYDIIRKKYLVAGPEEIVRQYVVHFLINERNVPQSLIAVEKELVWNNIKRRTDIVVFDKKVNPKLIIECKAPYIKLSQEVLEQISRYNLALKVPYLMITNGLQHFCCSLDFNKKSYQFLSDLPNYNEMV